MVRRKLTWKTLMVEKSLYLRKTKTLTQGQSTRFRAFCTSFNMSGLDSKWIELIGMSKKPNCRYAYNISDSPAFAKTAVLL